MKKLIIVALLIVGLSTYAQDQNEKPQKSNTEKMNPELAIQSRVDRMTKELNLNTEQQEKIKQLYTDQAKNRESMMAQIKDKKDSGRSEMMAQQMKANEAKMKEILTAEQFTNWKSNQDKMREKMQQKMQEKQSGGNITN